MTEHIQITSDGEAIIPKDVCERLNWRPGTEVEIEPGAEIIVVRSKQGPRKGISYEEFRRRVPKHEGPPVSVADMDEATGAAMAERWKAKEARSR